MAGNANFDSPLISTTLNTYQKTLVDNIFKDMPFLYWLRTKGRMRGKSGGLKIVMPILYGKNSTVRSYAGAEVLDTAEQSGISAAEYEWKQVAGAITISGADERKNSGSEEQLLDLLEAKTEQTTMSLQDSVTTMLYADGTGNDTKDILGLAALVKDTPTTGSVGNISRATNTWWRNQYTTAAKTTTAYDNLLGAMRSQYRLASHGANHPDLILSDGDTYDGYESLCVQNQRFTDNKTADAGFVNLKFKGAVIMYDNACPGDSTDGRMYFINSKHLRWWYMMGTHFDITPFQRPKDQDVKTAQVLLMANLCADNLARQGIITGIT